MATNIIIKHQNISQISQIKKMKVSVKPYINHHQHNQQLNRKKITITNHKSKKTDSYIYSNFIKQFYRALDHCKVGELVTWNQMLKILAFMGFIDDEPTELETELSRTLTYMLSNPIHADSYKAVSRTNLLHFLIILCDIPEHPDHLLQMIGALPGLPTDSCSEHDYQPLVIIRIGQFDSKGRWSCSKAESQQIKEIFSCMKMKRISKSQIESRKRNYESGNTSMPDHHGQSHKVTLFKPKINQKSSMIAEKLFSRLKNTDKKRVENRLLSSKQSYHRKMTESLNKSLEKQLQGCTFKPRVNSVHRNSLSSLNKTHSKNRYRLQKQNQLNQINISLANTEDNVNQLLAKGQQYKNRRQKLHELKIKLDESAELSECTFKPHTTKHINNNNKWVYVRNREKQIERLEEGRKRREYLNTVKQRGYPSGVNWHQFVKSKNDSSQKLSNKSIHSQTFINNSGIAQPILVIDLKILENNSTINVYENDSIRQITHKVLKHNQIPDKFSEKVQQLIQTAITRCEDVEIQEGLVVSRSIIKQNPRKLYY